MTLDIRPITAFKNLCFCILCLLIMNILAIPLQLRSENQVLKNLAQLFNFNGEINIPATFSTLILLACALLLFYIFRVTGNLGKQRWRWLILSLIFLFLALDEFVSIHERIMFMIKADFDFSGIFYYAWIIPYGLAVILLAIFYIPFILGLPAKTKTLFFTAAFFFVTGAIGFEIFGGQQEESYGRDNYAYAFFYTIEELFEMLGVTIFIYALLSYISDFTGAKEASISWDVLVSTKEQKAHLSETDP